MGCVTLLNGFLSFLIGAFGVPVLMNCFWLLYNLELAGPQTFTTLLHAHTRLFITVTILCASQVLLKLRIRATMMPLLFLSFRLTIRVVGLSIEDYEAGSTLA